MASIATRRKERVAASKKKRKTVLVVVGAIALVAVLVIQVPLDPRPALVGMLPSVSRLHLLLRLRATPKPPAEAARLLEGLAVVDPFATRKLASGDPAPRAVAAPAGARDPFVKVATSTVLSPKRIVIGTPTAGATPTVGYIVVLASIRTGAGRGVAERIAARARGTPRQTSVCSTRL